MKDFACSVMMVLIAVVQARNLDPRQRILLERIAQLGSGFTAGSLGARSEGVVGEQKGATTKQVAEAYKASVSDMSRLLSDMNRMAEEFKNYKLQREYRPVDELNDEEEPAHHLSRRILQVDGKTDVNPSLLDERQIKELESSANDLLTKIEAKYSSAKKHLQRLDEEIERRMSEVRKEGRLE